MVYCVRSLIGSWWSARAEGQLSAFAACTETSLVGRDDLQPCSFTAFPTGTDISAGNVNRGRHGYFAECLRGKAIQKN